MSGNLVLGLERCLDQPPRVLRSARIGLLMNRASVDRRLRLSCECLGEIFPGQITAIFSPQHGLWGDAQANMIESDHGWYGPLDIPIHSLYSQTRRPSPEMLAGIDCLVIDLQDVGTRVYTFAWTMLECLRACAKAGVAVLVLDRPNPVGGWIVEGPMLEEDHVSFVGGASIPMRHGLTIAELARLMAAEFKIDVELHVHEMKGWNREQTWSQSGRTWIPPSPNLPRIESALVYPGQVLLEGTNLSEGRGTTTPFEVVGAPFVDPQRLWESMNDLELPGVRFLPASFRPTFDKWSGQLCGGVSIHVTDQSTFRAVRTTLAVLQYVVGEHREAFEWLSPPYEYENQKMPIDIIFGSSRLRESIDAPESLAELAAMDVEAWTTRVGGSWIYPRHLS